MKNFNPAGFNWFESLFDSSKNCIDMNIGIVCEHPGLFDSLLRLSFCQKSKQAQRASRVVCQSIECRPELFSKYIPVILDSLPSIKNESIKFCFFKIFTFCELPEDEDSLGLLTQLCFDAVEANVDRVALKVYAIEILYRISQIYPDMKFELLCLFKKYMLGAQTAYISRATKLISKLYSELNLTEEKFPE